MSQPTVANVRKVVATTAERFQALQDATQVAAGAAAAPRDTDRDARPEGAK